MIAITATCINEHIVESTATNLANGETFTKYYTVPVGEVCTVSNVSKGLMTLTFKTPLTANNESVAPYWSRLHRTYIMIEEEKINWNFGAETVKN